MGKTHMELLPSYHQNGLVATQVLGHKICVMYTGLLGCI